MGNDLTQVEQYIVLYSRVMAMKFLALSDAHGVYTYIDQLLFKAGDVDAVCMLGDITDFGPNSLVGEVLGLIGDDVPTLMIPGNCDLPTIVETIEESSAVNLHLKSFDFDTIKFLGIGGSNPTPFNTPFEFTEEEMDGYMKELLTNAGETTVLLSHAPPMGFLDVANGVHVGSEGVRRAVGVTNVIACGHIHEQRGVTTSNGTTIVNPGMAARGCGALIEVVPESEPKVALIQV